VIVRLTGRVAAEWPVDWAYWIAEQPELAAGPAEPTAEQADWAGRWRVVGYFRGRDHAILIASLLDLLKRRRTGSRRALGGNGAYSGPRGIDLRTP